MEPLNFLSPEQRQNVVSKLVGDRVSRRRRTRRMGNLRCALEVSFVVAV